jgi:hypothetical protein
VCDCISGFQQMLIYYFLFGRIGRAIQTQLACTPKTQPNLR